ncbi:MAG: DNRLRE domain-containing protein, partial [Ruminococcus sp.]|nr:DNRLRE domain-containing protein [Ruminococcus sp.]
MQEIELINLRKKREKHFLQNDGSIIAKVYNEDIHFKKDNKYIEIDNTLIKEGNYYRNRQNDYQVYFKDISNYDFFNIRLNKHYLDISLINNNIVNPVISDNSITYNNIFKGIDIEYIVLADKIKENVIIKDKNNKITELDFIIGTALDLVIDTNKILAKENDRTIFTMEAPYMIDSNNNINYNINYELIKYDQVYHLKLILDEEWLDSATYPIVIDPTITNSGNSNSVYDTYIYSGDTNIDRNNQDILKVGVEKVNNQNRVNRTLIKFNLPMIGTGSQVVDATLDLIGYGYDEAIYDSEIITIHQITKDWDEQTANWNTMHNNYNPRIEAYFNNYFSTLIYDYTTKTYNLHSANCTANITNLVRKWYSNTPNYGIMLKTNEEVYKSNKVPAFYSKNNHITGNSPKPILIIKYRNQNGLENYMDYQSQVFSQGNVYVNTYTGNLTGLFNLGDTISGKLPAILNLIYNTNDVILNNNYGLGIGYKFNYYQTIKSVIIEDIKYLEYLDEDGTIHYFIQEAINGTVSNNKYVDEDGLNMTIEVSNNIYTYNYDKLNNIKTIYH